MNNVQAGDIIRYTSCGDHCWNMCVLKVHIRDGKIIAVEPDDTINPGLPREDSYVSKETVDRCMVQLRPCAKGYVHTRYLYDPNRVIYPMKRVGKRGEGKFERISWDEALDTIAKKLVEVKKKYGPYSIKDQDVMFPLSPWFGAGCAGWGSHSWQGSEEPRWWVLGTPMDGQQDEANLFKAKLIVLWGFNPVSTLSSNRAVYNLLRAREMGIPVICIESRYTPSAEVIADQWIPIRPSTDVAMMIAMANVWFKEDLCDKQFIEKWVEADGLQRWKDYVLGMSDGIDKTPKWAETICGVPEETITAFARLYAKSKPVNVCTGLTMGRQFFGENGVRALKYLQALTGNIGIPGAAEGPFGGITRDTRGKPSIPLPSVDYQRTEGPYKSPVRMVHFRWPLAVDLRDKLDKGEIGKDEYNHAIVNLPGNDTPNIQMAILEGGNPFLTHPDINTNIRAFNKMDFVVVFTYYTDNPGAKYADILLPQIHKAFEGRDADLFQKGRNCLVYCQKCVDPPGEVKPKEWIWIQLAKRLGIADEYSPRLANVPDDKWDEVMEELHQEAYEKWASRKEVMPLRPPSWQEFQKNPVFRWEIKEPKYPYKSENGENPFQGTASGKIEFYSEELARGPDYVADTDRPGVDYWVYRNHLPAPKKYYGGGNLPPMAQMTFGGKSTYYSKDTEKYPLLMASPHSLFRIHTMHDNQPLLNQDCYRHAVWLSVPDAKARGIKDNDMVKVYNDVGEIIMPAYVTSRIVPGTVALFHGGWYIPGETKSEKMPEGVDTRGAPNVLTHYDEHLPDTIVNHLPCKGLVEIEKWEGA